MAVTINGTSGITFNDGSTESTAGAVTKSASGYQKLPSGVFIQWGSISGTSATWPIAFPTACTAVATTSTNSATGGANNRAVSVTTTGATLGSYADSGCYFIAVGY